MGMADSSDSGDELTELGVPAPDASDVTINADEIDEPSFAVARGQLDEPARDVEALSTTLERARQGQELSLTFGLSYVESTLTGEILGTYPLGNDGRYPGLDWDYMIEVEGSEGGDDIPGRVYRIGAGDTAYEPWLIYSYDCIGDTAMIKGDDSAWHGWVIDAAVESQSL